MADTPDDGKELRQKKPMAGVMPWIGAAMLAAVGGMMVWRVCAEPCNHVGFDIRQAWLPCGLGLLWGLMGLARGRDRRPAAFVLIAVSVLVAALVLVLDQWNVLVEYHRWIERGMPDRWHFGGRS